MEWGTEDMMDLGEWEWDSPGDGNGLGFGLVTGSNDNAAAEEEVDDAWGVYCAQVAEQAGQVAQGLRNELRQLGYAQRNEGEQVSSLSDFESFHF